MKWSLFIIRTMVFAVFLCSASSLAVAQGTQIQGPKNAADAYSGVVYGPIDQSDTLWAISSQYRKNQQFTVYQVMLAIYELNPRAFVNRNFNTMVNGSMLQLPTDRYISRIDPQRAKAKAEQDDLAFAASTGRKGIVVNEANSEGAVTENMKPDVPLVNKEELDATSKQFQRQINALKQQQSAVFNEFKQQLGESIQATQAIVDENKLVLDRLAKKDEEFITLKTELSEDFQSKLDEQASQIQELREFVRLAQLREQREQENSLGSLIREPLFIIAVSSIAGLLIFLLVAMMLLRKPVTPSEEANSDASDPEKIELDDPASNDSDELVAMLENEELSDDDLLDDILSDELEESIDEVSLDDDDFGDIDDEMLVPDKKDKQANGGLDDGFDNDDLDEALLGLDDDDDLDESLLDSEFDGLDLDDVGDISLDETEEAAALDFETEEVDIDSILDEENLDAEKLIDSEFATEESQELQFEASSESAVEDDEQAEISIDDLLTQNSLDSDLPQGISLNEDGEIDEDVIDQIGAEISNKNTEINTLTSNFSEELQNKQHEDDDFDDTDDENVDLSKAESQKSIQPLDQLTEGLEDDIADAIANAEHEDRIDELESDELDDPLSDELLSELGAEQPENAIDKEIEASLSDPLYDEVVEADDADIDTDSDTDTDSALRGGFENLQTGTIDFEEHEEPDDVLVDERKDEEFLDADPLEPDFDGDAAFDEPDNIDIDSVLDDSLNDLLDKQSDAEDDIDLNESELNLEDEKDTQHDEKSLFPKDNSDSTGALVENEEQALNEPEDIDDIIADLETDEVNQSDFADISEEMLSELDASEDLEEIELELDDIELGELSNVESQDLPVAENDEETSESERKPALELDDIPSLGADELPQQTGSQSESEQKSEQEANKEVQQEDEDEFSNEIDIEGSADTEVDALNESAEASKTQSTDDDILDLPDLDEWLEDDDDEVHAESKGKFNEELEKVNSGESDDDVLREIEEADFDSLLQEMGSLDDEQTTAEIEKLAIDDENETVSDFKSIDIDSENLDNPDLDLTALFDESSQESDKAKGFIDVDSLLQESENLTPATDEELELDLDMSLDKFLNENTAIDVDIDGDQASNLDLARVYMDMEDNEAALESLEEVLEKGSNEQKQEAKILIEKLKE